MQIRLAKVLAPVRGARIIRRAIGVVVNQVQALQLRQGLQVETGVDAIALPSDGAVLGLVQRALGPVFETGRFAGQLHGVPTGVIFPGANVIFLNINHLGRECA